jgi:predicted transporter
MKPITWLGAIIALLGVLGLAIPVFTTSQTRDVASLGDIKIQSTEQSTHVVPVALSASGLLLGLVLIGAGVYTRRDAQRV